MIIDGAFAAKYFKYLSQLKSSYVQHKLPFDRIQAKCLYQSHKRHFDILATICNKYKIDLKQYLDFYINKLNKFQRDIDSSLVSVSTIKQYADHLQIAQQQKNIYKCFMKTVSNIVEDCLRLHYNSTSDYLRHLIAKRQLAAYYAAGKISVYFLAAIPKFKKVIDKLDCISKAEFSELYERYDKYHFDVNSAFLKVKNIKVNPLKVADDAIFEAKTAKNYV